MNNKYVDGKPFGIIEYLQKFDQHILCNLVTFQTFACWNLLIVNLLEFLISCIFHLNLSQRRHFVIISKDSKRML